MPYEGLYSSYRSQKDDVETQTQELFTKACPSFACACVRYVTDGRALRKNNRPAHMYGGCSQQQKRITAASYVNPRTSTHPEELQAQQKASAGSSASFKRNC